MKTTNNEETMDTSKAILTDCLEYSYLYKIGNNRYTVSNFYVESTTYNAYMVRLTFREALERCKSQLIGTI